MDDSIQTLNLTARSQNNLLSENIRLVSQLTKFSERELLKIPNMGRKSINEIKQQLDKFGFRLSEDTKISSRIMARDATLLDYFASKAMQALIQKSNHESSQADLIANVSYIYAEAMVKKRRLR